MAVLWMIALPAFVVADDALPGKDKPDSALVSDGTIEAMLVPIREKHRVPGLIAGTVNRQGLVAAGVVGARKYGSPEPMTINDHVHLGSNTKAMTATRLAMLVEEGKLSWQSTLGEVFSDLKAEFHDDFVNVTLEQLLTHRAGLPANVMYPRTGGSIVAMRESVVKRVLSNPPLHPPGTKFLYSNLGYIIAGHTAERVTDKSWEQLMTDGLFTPLEMTSAGFGFPGTKGLVDQPWGHKVLIYNPIPLQLDNAEALGPAGTVHCSLADWAQFAALHLQGARGEGTLLKPTTFHALHTPPVGEKYAMGWAVKEYPWADGPVLEHSGSNTMWFATIVVSPKRDLAFLAATNVGPPSGHQACDAAIAALIEHESKSP